ncbi:MAG: Holliday junction resolvase RuvX [Candidatus Moranbacteria bacterium]|nr:Holliday junction resolvase RuvX [Candidatus Moranbacteria bacterium]
MKLETQKQREKNQKENYLGIDFGTKKIGLALAPRGALALKFLVIPNDKDLFFKLSQIVEEHAINFVVVGKPLNMDGAESKLGSEVENFVGKLEEIIPTPIVTYDERFSTGEAKRNLPKENLEDAEAARIILQGYLDNIQAQNPNIK